MQLQSADEVWGRIEATARSQPGGILATDGDGTLWSGDVGEDLFHAFLQHGRVEAPAFEEMRRQARTHGLSDAGAGPDVARRLYDAYLDGRFPEERVCELMTWCFAGWAHDEVQAFARDVVHRNNLEARIHDEVTAVLSQARAIGIGTFLVSASPVAVVIEAGALLGFEAHHIVAARPRFEAGTMLACVEEGIPYGPGKVQRLRDRIGQETIIYASFGDNAFDVALLASAHIAVAVRPKPRLRERATEVAGLVELVPRPRSAKA